MVASFTGGRFRSEGWDLEKVSAWDLDGEERAFLRRRPPYDYSLNPSQRGRGQRRGWLEWPPVLSGLWLE